MNLKEFKAAISPWLEKHVPKAHLPPKAQLEAMIEKAFHYVDKNNDGEISSAELEAAIAKHGG